MRPKMAGATPTFRVIAAGALWLTPVVALAQPEDAPRDPAHGSGKAEPDAAPEKPVEPRHVNEEPLPEQPAIADDAEREVPDYDGRGDDPTTFGDVALWVPRLAVSPLYLVSEYVIRQPLGWVATKAEEEDLPAILVDFFTFGPDRTAGIVPTTLIDFGFQPSVGLYAFWNDFLTDANNFTVRGATGGPDWIAASASDRYEFWAGHELSLRAGFSQRPDWVFHGLGPESSSVAARFSERRLDAAVEYDAHLWRTSRFSAHVGLRDASYDGSIGCCGDRTVDAAVAAGRFALPPGFSDGYSVLLSGFSAALDTRRRRHLDPPIEGSDHVAPPGGGVRLAVRAEHAAGLGAVNGEPDRHEWVRYGGTLGGFLDVGGHQRVLGLSVIADFADPLQSDGEIPFTELVGLGGERPLRGFLHGRLWDRSCLVAELEYRWPVWV